MLVAGSGLIIHQGNLIVGSNPTRPTIVAKEKAPNGAFFFSGGVRLGGSARVELVHAIIHTPFYSPDEWPSVDKAFQSMLDCPRTPVLLLKPISHERADEIMRARVEGRPVPPA